MSLLDLTRVISERYNAADSVVSSAVFQTLNSTFGINFTSTPTTKGLPLVDSPFPLLLSLSIYLIVIFLGTLRIQILGLKPRERDPWILRAIVVLHNLFLFFLSLYMCLGIVVEAIRNRYSIWGNAYREQETKMAHLLYIFYVSKYIEFGDTLIMVVKRNVRQITFLHMYHHSSVAIIWWLIVYHAPGGEAYFSAALNSGVHVAMYGYYCLAALLGKDEKLRKKYLFWGRYLTQCQMTQFVANWFQGCYDLIWKVPYPLWLSTVLFFYMVTLLILFANFYIRKYFISSGKKAPKVKKDA